MKAARHDWPERLAAFVAARRELAFSWEEANCGFVACDWVRLRTGIDPAEAYRGQNGALATMRRVKAAGGAEAIFERAAILCGWAQVPPAYARRGDVVLHRTPRGAALGIVDGTHGLFMQKIGLGPVPLSACARAWRIA
jgi:hypothetical protein